MSDKAIQNFLWLLKKSPSGAVFNPWWQVDKENDIGRNAPGIRRRHLRAYLRARQKNARLAVIGEALGYRGGHFSGIPMTSERILLGKKKDAGIEPKDVFSGVAARTSKRQKCRDGFSEPTATIVWSTLLHLGLQPEQFVLWNAPTQSERSAGVSVLEAFLELFPCDQVVALGHIGAAQLADLSVEAQYVRHPASGGAKLFRQQIAKVVAGLD